ncbi:MAG: dihydrofolate reductase [Massilia sp.]|jgi:dihydrofolate reductase|nr:dihydrofolate reductase [Massilia sp.]
MNNNTITLVVAMDRKRGIGVDNALPWHLPEDLAHFKRVTTGHPIIMGRKTFESIGRPLPNRRNIVVTRDAQWAHAGVEAAPSLDAAIGLLEGAPACIIGGGQIFAQALERGLADRAIVTEIDRDFACDTFFPPLPAGWTETARERHQSAGGIDYSFVTYEKAD